MRIFIYGTGKYAVNFFCYVPEMIENISGFIESRKSKNLFLGKKVFAIDEVGIDDYDLIIVASQFIHEIKAEMYKNNIDFGKVIFLAQTWIAVRIDGNSISYDFTDAKNQPEDSCAFFDLSGVYTTSEMVADYYAKDDVPEVIWNKIPQYEVSVHAPHLAAQQRVMLENDFIPLVSRTDYICDIGCASGEWSRFLSPYVKHIDAFDISKPMIETAKNVSTEYGFNNIDFTCKNMNDVSFERIYDSGIMLGIGIFFEELSFNKLVEKVASHMRMGGYLAVRDTVTMYTDKKVYLARKGTDHIFGNYRGRGVAGALALPPI